MLDILFECGASFNVPDGQKSPLVEAVGGGYVGLIDELRAKGRISTTKRNFCSFLIFFLNQDIHLL